MKSCISLGILLALGPLCVIATSYKWIPMLSTQPIPDDTLVGGTFYNDTKSYTLLVGRAMHLGEIIPGKFTMPITSSQSPIVKGDFSCIYNGSVQTKTEFQLLVGPDDFDWFKMLPHKEIPTNAIKGGEKSNGKPYYIGRVKHNGRHKDIGKVDSENKFLYTSSGAEEKVWTEYEMLIWGRVIETSALDDISPAAGKYLLDKLVGRYQELLNNNYPLVNTINIYGYHNHTWNIAPR